MRMLRFVLGAVAALSLSACVQVTTPIGTSVGYVNDPALEGMWIGKPDEKKSVGYYHVILNDNHTLTVIGISPRTGDDKASWGVVELTTVVLGGHHYLNAREISESGGDPDKTYDRAAFYPLYYTVKGDTLTLFTFDEAKVKAAIQAGRIEGTITSNKLGSAGSYDTVTITDDGAHLDALLKTPDAPALFEPLMEMHR
ncbi:MAG TPA: hypothetical protein VHZ78_02175 [Rhizomicrobium sp.]|jgi:hypothetical protein|nr:hypothetical protein [Rhizomicrobium sp.]